MSVLRGVRGATTVAGNDAPAIVAGAQELLTCLVQANDIDMQDIGAVIFSSTPDLNAAFPAAGARSLGWNEVPLFGAQEIETPDGPPLCIRVLILWNTDKPQQDIQPVYLHGAKVLRPDLIVK